MLVEWLRMQRHDLFCQLCGINCSAFYKSHHQAEKAALKKSTLLGCEKLVTATIL